jgi:hypothetical protein
MKTASLRLPSFAVLQALALSACDAHPDPGRLTGTWAFTDDAAIVVTCMNIGGELTMPIGATPVHLRETQSGVELDFGCRCRLALTRDGTLTSAPQSCKLMIRGLGDRPYHVDATILSWTTRPDGASPDTLYASASGDDFVTAIDADDLMCGFRLEGQLTRTESLRPSCGEDRTAVGVYTVGPPCPLGAGTDGVVIDMGDDLTTGCTAVAGDLGEPSNPPPEAVKSPPPCVPGGAKRSTTRLSFCRVDGQLFKPFIGNQAFAYAVLKLGQQCPPGAVDVIKDINNDDAARQNGALGDLGPNQSHGAATQLHFCVFPAVDDPNVDTLSSFPNLGFVYGVFHDFEGFQPPWVRAKHWKLSDDESGGTLNEYSLLDGSREGAAIDLLKRMVEDVPPTSRNDTMFDFAVVR